MQVTRYGGVDEFLAKTQSFLEQEERVNSLLLGNCLKIKRFPDRADKPSVLASVEENGSLVLAAMMAPPHNIVLASGSAVLRGALAALCEALEPEQDTIPGVLARQELSAAFAEAWSARTGRKSREHIGMRFYCLTAVKPVGDAPGSLRAARAGDVELLTPWFQGFTKDVFGEDVAADESRKQATTRIEDGDLYVWEDGGVVSMAAKASPTEHGIRVNHVYTPPDLRKRGYGTACVAALSQALLDSGWQYCCLYADLQNPTSNGIYQRIGYEPLCKCIEYAFEKQPAEN